MFEYQDLPYSARRVAAFFIILSCLWCHYTIAQTSLVKAIDNNLIEIESKQPNDNFANFDQFSGALTKNKILAVGEVTHGVKELMDFRGTLIKYLVTKLNYKVIVVESDFSGAKLINDYILYGKGDKHQSLMGMMGIWRNKEFVNIIHWLKEYNLTQPFAKKVKLYGCDMQTTLTAAWIANGSVKLKNGLSDDSKKALTIMQNIFHKVSGGDRVILQKLRSELSDEISLLPDTSLRSRSILTVVQSIDWFQAGDWYQRGKIRDKSMAENVAWLYEHEQKNNMVFLAHNTHIAKNPIYDDIKRAGFYLKEKYKDEYYALGLSFFTGEFLASDEKTYKLQVFTMPEIKDELSSEYIFSQCRTPNFILDFETTKKDPDINLFLTKKTYSKNIGASYTKSNKEIKPGYMPLADKFDGIGFFRKTSALLPPFTWEKKE